MSRNHNHVDHVPGVPSHLAQAKAEIDAGQLTPDQYVARELAALKRRQDEKPSISPPSH